ncbi:hypothetical protein MMC13_007969 [Lambiella insularis]|nr:hypothetical protein [Lambiella insularis]
MAAPASKAAIHGGGSGKSPVSGVVAPSAPLKPKSKRSAGPAQGLLGPFLAPILDFDSAVIKGKEVWKNLQDALKDYPPDKPVSLDGLKKNGWTIRDFPPTAAPRNLANIYKQLILSSTDKNYISRMATHSVPGTDKPTLYGNIYNTADGVVIADDNRKAKGEKINWSEVTFTLLQDSAHGNHVDNLHFVIRHNIKNEDTQLIIQEAYRKIGRTISEDLQSWGPESKDDIFYAFIGTENGKGVVRMLADYPHAFNKKTVHGMYTGQSKSDGEYHLIFLLGASEHPLQLTPQTSLGTPSGKPPSNVAEPKPHSSPKTMAAPPPKKPNAKLAHRGISQYPVSVSLQARNRRSKLLRLRQEYGLRARRRHAILSSRAYDHYGNTVRRDIPLHYSPRFEQTTY